jgi:hypothetical protein
MFGFKDLEKDYIELTQRYIMNEKQPCRCGGRNQDCLFCDGSGFLQRTEDKYHHVEGSSKEVKTSDLEAVGRKWNHIRNEFDREILERLSDLKDSISKFLTLNKRSAIQIIDGRKLITSIQQLTTLIEHGRKPKSTFRRYSKFIDRFKKIQSVPAQIKILTTQTVNVVKKENQDKHRQKLVDKLNGVKSSRRGKKRKNPRG